MELGLSLGGETNPSKPLSFSTKNKGLDSQNHPNNIDNNKNLGLRFCMGLGINNNNNSSGRKESRRSSESKENNDVFYGDEDADDDRTSSERTRDDDDDDEDYQRKRGVSVDIPLQLDLLPLAPVPRPTPIRAQPLRWSSDNGSSDNGSSGNVGLPAVAKGFDVNRLPSAGGVVEEVSSPNSVASASAFQMDLNIFRGGENLANGGNKREFGAAGNDVVEAERASSRASDDDENALNARKKLRLSKEQSAYLEESFKEHNTLNPKQKLALAKQLNLRPRQVEVWFQNRRARTKLKQTEVDCEYLKRRCETLTEENRRLHKDLQELRALKTPNPFYMQSPATTLTMCPSCERVATTSTTAPSPTTTSNPTTTAATIPSTSSTNGKTNTVNTSDSISNAIPFPISRPRFYPFAAASASHTIHHPHQSAAS
ncbi:hypothetical protein ACH5RR_023499 [Cinchona calisaya]|uniref:Homeobox domain-containing protein n=1 Tax=Cinchona calisaya TaxID=153742 RepID=A0ABD2ZAU7_9GENT